MKGYFRQFRHTIARTFDFAGRAARGEVFGYIVISQALVMVIAWLTGWFAPVGIERWAVFAVQAASLVPAAALIVRRLHDFGWSGRWSLVLLAIAVRSIALDLLGLVGGSEARGMIESLLAYVDWLLFLPFVAIYVLLLAMPGMRAPNRFGPGLILDVEPRESSSRNPLNLNTSI